MLELFPDTAALDGGELTVGGARLSALADEHGTPLVVYCEETLRARARAYREAAPDALVLYSAKAFPNVALLRLFSEEGLGADVSTAGELAYARRAGIPGERIVLHGNNKSEDELRAGAQVALVVVDALDEIERARAAGVRTALVRVTPGIDVDTHPAIGTAHYGSKFGLPPDQALEAIARLRDSGPDAAGLHVHLGSQVLELGAARLAVDWLGAFAAECRERLGWKPTVIDVGGGLGVRYSVSDPQLPIAHFVRTVLDRLDHTWRLHDLPPYRLVLEPGRSLVGQAGVTLYRVGVVKRASETTTYVAIDGGMSDNPRPQLYGARLTAVLANRADETPAGAYAVCGKHCESGDVLIDRSELPEPRRGDVLAVAATGAYTLAMASNYNGVPRPAAVLVRDGGARVIRRRETVDDLLSLEV